jgi:hypothetical protein
MLRRSLTLIASSLYVIPKIAKVMKYQYLVFNKLIEVASLLQLSPNFPEMLTVDDKGENCLTEQPE